MALAEVLGRGRIIRDLVPLASKEGRLNFYDTDPVTGDGHVFLDTGREALERVPLAKGVLWEFERQTGVSRTPGAEVVTVCVRGKFGPYPGSIRLSQGNADKEIKTSKVPEYSR